MPAGHEGMLRHLYPPHGVVVDGQRVAQQRTSVLHWVPRCQARLCLGHELRTGRLLRLASSIRRPCHSSIRQRIMHSAVHARHQTKTLHGTPLLEGRPWEQQSRRWRQGPLLACQGPPQGCCIPAAQVSNAPVTPLERVGSCVRVWAGKGDASEHWLCTQAIWKGYCMLSRPHEQIQLRH